MKAPIVSVIIPVYNAGPYIDRCIQSVLEQTFDCFEVIAVNDGSTDDSLYKLIKWKSIDLRIRVLDKRNEGVVKARADAIEIVKGRYLFFLDADDYLPAYSIETMVATLEKNHADICIGSYALVRENSGKQIMVNHRKNFYSAIGCLKYCLKYGEMFLPIKLYKTDLFRKYVDIPCDVIVQEDTIGVTQYLEHIRRVAFTNKCVYCYYKHGRSVTSFFSEKHAISSIKVVRFLKCSFFYTIIPKQIDRYIGRVIQNCRKRYSLNMNNEVEQLFQELPFCVKIELKIREIKNTVISRMRKIIAVRNK